MGWLFEYEGPLPATFSYRVREWGAYVGPASISVTISAASALRVIDRRSAFPARGSMPRSKHSNGSAWSSVEIRHYQADGPALKHDRTSNMA